MNNTAIAAAVFAVVTALPAAAAELSPWYLSGVIGQSSYKVNNADFSPFTVKSVDKKDTQFGVAAGYRFSPNLAFEVGYLDFGKAKVSTTFQGVGANFDGKVSSVHASLIVGAPLGEVWSVYGRLGAARSDRKLSGSVGSPSVSASTSDKKTEALLGLGAGYAFAGNLTGTLEYQKLNDTDVSAINVGLRLAF